LVTISTTYPELDKLKYNNSIITIGSFDGLHLGHQKVFKKMNALSSNSNKKILITFDPHPFTVLNKRQNEKYYLLESTNEKVEILNSFKNSLIDIVVIIKFDKELSHISATDFFTKILKCFNPIDVVMGHDNGFGHKREGNINFLKDRYNDKGFKLHTVSPEQNNIQETISSTLIRQLIKNGKIDKANNMLGRSYSVKGHVVRGEGLGKTINFPTINISLSNELQIVPSSGVYFVYLEIDSNKYTGMCNIGFRPTVTNNKEETIEIHIFRVKTDKDFYGKEVKVFFVEYIREEKKFKNIDFLAKQLEKDKNYCLSIKV
tara:strand:- start:278 stop:1231 length:954 start_codon:yes stop_codon:yes gene_type:complete